MTVVEHEPDQRAADEPALPTLSLDAAPSAVVEAVRRLLEEILGRWLPPSQASSLPGGLGELAAVARTPASVPYQLAGLVLRLPTAQAGDPWDVAPLRAWAGTGLARLRVVPLHFDGDAVHYATPDVPTPALNGAVADAFGVCRARPLLCTAESFGEWSLPSDPGRRPTHPTLATPLTGSSAWMAALRPSPLPPQLLQRLSAAAGLSAAAAIVVGDPRATDVVAPLLTRLTGLPVARAEVSADVHAWLASAGEAPGEPTPTVLIEQVRDLPARHRGLGWHAALAGLSADQRVRLAGWALGAPWLSAELAVLVAARRPSAVGEVLADPYWAMRPDGSLPNRRGLVLGVPPMASGPDPTRDAYAAALLQHPLADALTDELAAAAMSRVQTGCTLDEALAEIAPDLAATALLARQAGLPTVDLDPRPVGEARIDALGRPCRATTWHDPIGAVGERVLTEPDVVPVGRDADGTLLVAVADPLTPGLSDRLAVAAAAPVRIAVAGRDQISRARRRLLARRSLESALAQADPCAPERVARRAEDSAHQLLTPGQKVALAVGALCVALPAMLAPWATAAALVVAALAVLVLAGAHRWWLAVRQGLRVTPRCGDAALDADLPVVTVLVPLDEARRDLSALLRGLAGFEYPADRLDLKLLVDHADSPTRAVLAATPLPANAEVLVVPPSIVAGRYKAANVGLLHARGRYAVLHDPSAAPRSCPLRAAAHAFAGAPHEVVCLQAPFGSTAFFRTDWLRTAGGWDPFNRVAPTDLGIRIRRLGGQTEVLDGAVEHAVESGLRGGVRSVVGYAQTYLVHMRRPRRLAADLGVRGFLGFQCRLGGTLLAVVALPVLWALVGLWTLGVTEVGRAFPGSTAGVSMLGTSTAFFASAHLLGRPARPSGRRVAVGRQVLTAPQISPRCGRSSRTAKA